MGVERGRREGKGREENRTTKRGRGEEGGCYIDE